jgi:hypothetical protein
MLMQPGETIGPGAEDQKPNSITEPKMQNTPALSAESPANEPDHTKRDNTQPPTQTVGEDLLSWSASEYIEHQKPKGWYVGVVLAGALLAVLLYVVTKDLVTVAVVLIGTLLFSVVGSHKPESKNYQIGTTGITVGEKHFVFDDFKSFSLIEEGVIDSVQLMPLKRFTPPISMYFPSDIANQVVDTLADYLPHEERQRDMVDTLMKRLKF